MIRPNWLFGRAVCTALVALAVPALTAFAGPSTILHVDADAPPGGDGSGWQTAFRHLQDALAAAGPLAPAEIRVAQGRYTPDRSEAAPNGTGDRLAAFHLLDAVALMGGYAGRAAPDPDQRDPARFVSVLSGDLLGNDDPNDADSFGDNSYHVIESWHNDATAIVDGFVIRDGRANRPFQENWWPDRRDDSGAGALLVHSDAVFRHCRFTANHAEANAQVWIALSGPFAFVEPGGGAMLISRGAPTIESCVFEANSANRMGGAIGLHRSPARIARCEFINNRVGNTDSADFGGAIGDMSADFSSPDRARVESCRFINNHAIGGGGAVFTIFSNTVYANCLFLANHADDGGGGIMADNIAFVEFHNCAIVGNTSTARAAGVYEFSEVGDTYLFANCIVWANRSDEVIEPLNENMVSLGGNFAIHDTIVENASTHPIFTFEASRLFDADPLFADPIGPDGVPFSGDEDLRPSPGSPAIDAGASFRVPGWVTTDLDAKPRFIDVPFIPNTGLGPAPIVDIGPYEFGPGCSPADLAEPYGQLNFFDLAAYLALYNAGDPAADLAPPFGVLNFFDLAAYLDLYNAGCP